MTAPTTATALGLPGGYNNVLYQRQQYAAFSQFNMRHTLPVRRGLPLQYIESPQSPRRDLASQCVSGGHAQQNHGIVGTPRQRNSSDGFQYAKDIFTAPDMMTPHRIGVTARGPTSIFPAASPIAAQSPRSATKVSIAHAQERRQYKTRNESPERTPDGPVMPLKWEELNASIQENIAFTNRERKQCMTLKWEDAGAYAKRIRDHHLQSTVRDETTGGVTVSNHSGVTVSTASTRLSSDNLSDLSDSEAKLDQGSANIRQTGERGGHSTPSRKDLMNIDLTCIHERSTSQSRQVSSPRNSPQKMRHRASMSPRSPSERNRSGSPSERNRSGSPSERKYSGSPKGKHHLTRFAEFLPTSRCNSPRPGSSPGSSRCNTPSRSPRRQRSTDSGDGHFHECSAAAALELRRQAVVLKCLDLACDAFSGCSVADLAEHLFFKSLPRENIKDLKIVSLQDNLMKMRFLKLLQAEGGKLSRLQVAWHLAGSSSAADAIQSEGISCSPDNCCHGRYGNGGYVATTASKANAYGSRGERNLFLVLALPEKDIKHGKKGTRAECTVADSTSYPTEYCFVDHNRLYCVCRLDYEWVPTARRAEKEEQRSQSKGSNSEEVTAQSTIKAVERSPSHSPLHSPSRSPLHSPSRLPSWASMRATI